MVLEASAASQDHERKVTENNRKLSNEKQKPENFIFSLQEIVVHLQAENLCMWALKPPFGIKGWI